MTLGGRIKELRNQRGISQKKLGNALELSDSIITHYEQNSKKPSTKNLIKLAEYFNVTVDYLVGNSDKQSNKIDMIIKMFEFYSLDIVENADEVEVLLKSALEMYNNMRRINNAPEIKKDIIIAKEV